MFDGATFATAGELFAYIREKHVQVVPAFVVVRLPCRGLPAPARPLFFALRSATVCH